MNQISTAAQTATPTVTIVGRAREQYGKIQSDRYRYCVMEISKPYPHIAFFMIEAKDGRGISEIVGEMEDAEEVSIEFDLRTTSDGFEDIDPALSTNPNRITVTKAGPAAGD